MPAGRTDLEDTMITQTETTMHAATDAPDGGQRSAVVHEIIADGVTCSTFDTGRGTAEVHLVFEPPTGICVEKALRWLARSYGDVCAARGLSAETLAFARVYCSDITNQAPLLRSSKLYSMLADGAVSLIQQRPLRGSQIVVHAYHLRGHLTRSVRKPGDGEWASECTLDGASYRMHMVSNYGDNSVLNSSAQTERFLREYDDALTARGLTLRENTVRTWVYVRDIDNHYKGMVDARREYFAAKGLTRDTRYIASTGIEGIGPTPGALVSFDSLSFGNIAQEQIVRMETLDHMPPTIKYGVTFERGLRVRFGDRSQLYVSGTASIDADGNVMHEGDVVKQAGRMLENVRALLATQGGAIADLAYVLLYLRNPSDFDRVMDIVRPALPAGMPLVAAHGSVCRPTWLVEMEGVAMVSDNTEFPPFL